jgi:tetratricopeptide (TPR) repeat protein
VAVAALLLAGGAAAAWWWFQTPAVTPPGIPSQIRDPEVRRAIEAARQRVLDAPRSGAAWGHLGFVLVVHEFEHDAAVCLDEAARLDPADPRWPYVRGVLARKFDPSRAVPLLRQAAAVAGPGSKYRLITRLQLAEALLERGRLEEAEALLRAEEQRQPRHRRVALGLGQIAAARGDEALAAKYVTAARASPFARKKATAQLAVLARGRGDQQAAAAYEAEAAKLPADPLWPDPVVDELVQTMAGWTARERELTRLEREQRYAEAAAIYLKRAAERPTAADYVGAATNLARLGEYEQAVPLLQKAVKLEPDSAYVPAALAATLFERAKAAWQASPGSAQAREWFREVVAHARRATELRPDHAAAYLHWGLALKYLGEPAAAVAPLRKGVACQPADLDLQLGLGEALMESGQYREAKTHLENARLLAPDDPRTARALEQLRRKKP